MEERVSLNPNDDIWCAIRYNGTPFDSEIVSIIAEVCGENDGADWWWVVKLDNGKYGLLVGGCDYTGWDCQSYLNDKGTFATALEAAQAADEKDGYGRKILKNLLGQLDGSVPFATLIEEYRGGF